MNWCFERNIVIRAVCSTDSAISVEYLQMVHPDTVPIYVLGTGHYNCVISYCTVVVKKVPPVKNVPTVCRAVILDVNFLINVVRTVTA